jgi:Arc/MetJ-type ribon-helix-helix transcriptional regulator
MSENNIISVRMPDSILRQIDEMIADGHFSDRGDFGRQAMYYFFYKNELRREFKGEVISEVKHLFEKIIYSPEIIQNMDRMMRASIEDVINQVLKKD